MATTRRTLDEIWQHDRNEAFRMPEINLKKIVMQQRAEVLQQLGLDEPPPARPIPWQTEKPMKALANGGFAHCNDLTLQAAGAIAAANTLIHSGGDLETAGVLLGWADTWLAEADVCILEEFQIIL